jgi:hypothetical protein
MTKRFKPRSAGYDGVLVMEEHPNGKYVHYEDYETIMLALRNIRHIEAAARRYEEVTYEIATNALLEAGENL